MAFVETGLPLTLTPNFVSIYGSRSQQGFELTNPDIQFGIINQSYTPITDIATVGQSVMFRVSDAIPFNYNNITYFLLPETKIILVEDAVS